METTQQQLCTPRDWAVIAYREWQEALEQGDFVLAKHKQVEYTRYLLFAEVMHAMD